MNIISHFCQVHRIPHPEPLRTDSFHLTFHVNLADKETKSSPATSDTYEDGGFGPRRPLRFLRCSDVLLGTPGPGGAGGGVVPCLVPPLSRAHADQHLLHHGQLLMTRKGKVRPRERERERHTQR